MAYPSADWHLLFGLLALQNGLISQSSWSSAFAKWTSDKSVGIDELLVADGAIDPLRRDTLKQMVEFHVLSHGGDPHKSLMSLSGSDLPAAREDLNNSTIRTCTGRWPRFRIRIHSPRFRQLLESQRAAAVDSGFSVRLLAPGWHGGNQRCQR